MRIPRYLPIIALSLLPLSRADVRNCLCDVAVPETLVARECSLCVEAEKHPADIEYFFLRDANPTKPHRWLALPRLRGSRDSFWPTPNYRHVAVPAISRSASCPSIKSSVDFTIGISSVNCPVISARIS